MKTTSARPRNIEIGNVLVEFEHMGLLFKCCRKIFNLSNNSILYLLGFFISPTRLFNVFQLPYAKHPALNAIAILVNSVVEFSNGSIKLSTRPFTKPYIPKAIISSKPEILPKLNM